VLPAKGRGVRRAASPARSPRGTTLLGRRRRDPPREIAGTSENAGRPTSFVLLPVLVTGLRGAVLRRGPGFFRRLRGDGPIAALQVRPPAYPAVPSGSIALTYRGLSRPRGDGLACAPDRFRSVSAPGGPEHDDEREEHRNR
jgi:hypothetical protein